MHVPAYIILQQYRNCFFNSNIRRANISLMIMICISEAYWVFGVHAKIFVLNASIVSKNRTHIRILINEFIK